MKMAILKEFQEFAMRRNVIDMAVGIIIVAFAIFIVIKQMNRFRKKEAAPAPTTKECPVVFYAIPIKAGGEFMSSNLIGVYGTFKEEMTLKWELPAISLLSLSPPSRAV
jgi:hypothetical protein